MFQELYGLREQPFGVTPDPRYLYFSPGHREALASLFYGLETGRGFLALIAEPGMGKTTLLYQLLERQKDSTRSVFLFQTQCDSRELLRYVLDGLGLDGSDNDFVRMHARLNEFLFRQLQAQRRVVLFIDEAQNLSDPVLETVRLLSDFEATNRKLIQIVLAGQPELAHRLAQPSMGQLRQRIAVVSRLHPLPTADVVGYVNHRLQVAGHSGAEIFTPGALALVAESSHGIPRNINNICFGALTLGCAMGCKRIGRDIVQEAVADLSLQPDAEQPAPLVPAAAVPRPAPSGVRKHHWANRVKAWLLRPAVLAFVFAAVLIPTAVREGMTTAQSTAKASPRAAENASSPLPVAGPAPGGVAPRATPAEQAENREPDIVCTVRPRDTLSKLCIRTLGRYDAAVLAEVRRLNWNLWDPDLLRPGQQIRLPGQLPSAVSGAGSTDARNPQAHKTETGNRP